MFEEDSAVIDFHSPTDTAPDQDKHDLRHCPRSMQPENQPLGSAAIVDPGAI
jgi:hypothetical protein